MLAQNVWNPEKKLEGAVFHIYYMDLNTCVLFDKNLNVPCMWGSKTIVINALKHIDKEMNVSTDSKIRIYSYILGTDGFKKIQTYNGPISTIGKYIIRY